MNCCNFLYKKKVNNCDTGFDIITYKLSSEHLFFILTRFPCFPFCILSSIKHGLTGARVFLLGQVTVVGFIVVTSMTILLLITEFERLTQSI